MYDHRTNLIIAFHGCDESVQNNLLNNPNSIKKSEKPYDWLGHGLYFWENNYDRALKWANDKAKRNQLDKPSVIGAVLELKYCFDLLDSRFIETLKDYYELMKKSYKILDKELPKNRDISNDSNKDKILRELDCTVIEFMHQSILKQIIDDEQDKGYSDYKTFDSARGVFTEGSAIYPGAGIFDKSHIQICIRNPNCIKGFFLPRKESDYSPKKQFDELMKKIKK
jgi:hypothetical protein